MWKDLDIKDRHELIKLAVANKVYDLDTIRNMYDSQTVYKEGGPIGRKLINSVNARSKADFVERLKDANREYVVNPDGTVSTHRLAWATDDNRNAIVYPEIQNTPNGLVDYSNNTWNALDRAVENGDTLMMSPRQADWFTRNYKKYYPKFNKYDNGGNLKYAPYRENSSYTDKKLYKSVKKDFRRDPNLEYKDYEEYGVRVYNPNISEEGKNRKDKQDLMLNRIRQDFPEIQKNDVKKTAFKSNNLGWHNNNTGYMGTEDKRTLFGLQQSYDFVSNIVPYKKLGMSTPEQIRTQEENDRKNRNTTFDYTDNFGIKSFGGPLETIKTPVTAPNRTYSLFDLDTARKEYQLQKAIERFNIPNILPIEDNVRHIEPYTKIDDIARNMVSDIDSIKFNELIPGNNAYSRPIFVKTYKDGGSTSNKTTSQPEYLKLLEEELNKQLAIIQHSNYTNEQKQKMVLAAQDLYNKKKQQYISLKGNTNTTKVKPVTNNSAINYNEAVDKFIAQINNINLNTTLSSEDKRKKIIEIGKTFADTEEGKTFIKDINKGFIKPDDYGNQSLFQKITSIVTNLGPAIGDALAEGLGSAGILQPQLVNAMKDIINRNSGLGNIISRTSSAVSRYINDEENRDFKYHWIDSDVNPSEIQKYFEYKPSKSYYDNYTQSQLASIYDLSTKSKELLNNGKEDTYVPGRITGDAYKASTEDNTYAVNISNPANMQPIDVTQWSLGTTSGLYAKQNKDGSWNYSKEWSDEAIPVVSDHYNFDTDYTKYLEEKPNITKGQLLRLIFGELGSQGYKKEYNHVVGINNKGNLTLEKAALNPEEFHNKDAWQHVDSKIDYNAVRTAKINSILEENNIPYHVGK